MKILAILLLLSAAPAFAASNPCAAGKPGLDPKAFTRPGGYQPVVGDAKLGESLFRDTKLSSNGLSCNTCHQNHGSFQPSFAKPYPHVVTMMKEKAGVKTVHLDEMIQACMLMPMAARPLPWDSQELAALVAYTQNLQKTFRPGARSPANPCSAKPTNPGAKQ